LVVDEEPQLKWQHPQRIVSLVQPDLVAPSLNSRRTRSVQ
jgi:hypothetical protein